MAGIVYDLIDVLDEQKECYEGLNTLAKYKQEAVVNKDLKLLEEVVSTEEQFIGRLTSLDKKREVLMKDISFVTGMKYVDITVTKVIEKIGEQNDASQKLIILRDEIKIQLETLKKQSEVNKQLLSHSLELVDFMINAVGSTKGYRHVGNYGKPGSDVNVERQQSLFDYKQ